MTESKLVEFAAHLGANQKSQQDDGRASSAEGLRLIKAFSRIPSAARRAEVIAMIEEIAPPQPPAPNGGTRGTPQTPSQQTP
jgi:hypothetical protein